MRRRPLNVFVLLIALTTITAMLAGCTADDDKETADEADSGVEDDHQTDPEEFDSGGNPPPLADPHVNAVRNG